jgi:hypothetical protein
MPVTLRFRTSNKQKPTLPQHWNGLLALVLLLLAGSSAGAQTIKTLPGNYPSFSAAITDINANFASGGVTVLVAAGFTDQPATALPLLTAQGSASRPIVFQRAGSGGNPRIVAPAGTSTTTDAIVRLSGADYVTFDGIDLLDPSSHTNQTTSAEFGYAFFRASATNGCQNNTIKNCVVSMNRTNSNSTSGIIYGIYGASTTATGAAVTISAASGTNSYNNLYSNTVINTQTGIYLNGYADPNAPYSLLDQDNDVGGTATATGNTVMNFGGLAAAPAYGIRMVNQNDGNASYNSLNNAGNGGVASPNAFYGILFAEGRNASCTVTRNYIVIGQGLNNSTVTGILTDLGGTGTTTVQENTLSLAVAASANAGSTGARYLLANTGATATLQLNSNTANIDLSSTNGGGIGGTAYGLYNAGAVGSSASLSNNRVTYNLSGTSSLDADCYGVYNAGPSLPGSLTMSSNNISYRFTAAGGTLSGDAAAVANAGTIAGNLVMASNTAAFATTVSGGGTLSGQLAGVLNLATAAVTGTTTLDNNNISFPWLGTAAGTTSSPLQGVVNRASLTGAATLSGNTLSYGGGTSGGSFSSPFTGVLNSGATASTLQLSNNTLLNSYTNSTGAMTVFGSTGTSLGLLTISNNHYENSGTSSTGQVYFINATSASPNLLAQGNVFRNFTKDGSSAATVYGYYNLGQPTGAGTHTITNNTIMGLNLTGSSGAFASPFGGILSSPSLATTQLITSNTVGLLASGGAIATGNAPLTGIYAGGAGNSAIAGNIVQNLVGAGTIVGLTTTASPTDPLNPTGNLAGGSLYGNTISHLTTSNRPATVCGVFLAAKTSAAAVSAYGNRISNLSATGSTGSLAWGLYVAGGATLTLHNNLIGNLYAPAATSPEAVTGLYLNAGAALNVYYNTVYLDGGSTGAGFGAAGIAFSGSPTTIDLRNNLVVNMATATGTSLAVALRRTAPGTPGTAPGNLAATLNNNLLYGRYLYAEGLATGAATNALATLAAYRSFMNTADDREQRTVSQPVGFVSTNFLDSNFLRPGTGAPTPVASGAQPLSGFPTDFANVSRSTTTPDIGALEGGYTYLDQVAPIISYPALGNTTATTSPTLANVSVVDVAPGSGVPNSSNARPRVYYKLATDANVFSDNTSNTPGWKYAAASGGNSPFSFVLDYSLLYNRPTIVGGMVVQYFVVAQDGANTPNVALDYGLLATPPTSVDLKAVSFPLGAPGSTAINSFTITAPVVTTPPVTTAPTPPVTTAPTTPTTTNPAPPTTTPTTTTTTTTGAALPTTLLVGAGQAYTSLTNAGGAFAALNAGVLQGNTTLTVTSDLAGETGAVALSAPASGSYTLTIKSDGQLRTISGVATSLAGLIRLAGADRVLITGAQPSSTSQNLLFSNYTTGAPTFSFTAGASDNTLTNLLVESNNSNPSSGAIVLGGGSSTGNSNNTFNSLHIRPAGNATTASYANGLFSAGANATVLNTGINLTNSTVHDFSSNGFYAISNSTSCTVTGNSFYEQGSRSTALCAVRLDAGGAHTVSNNLFYQTTGTLSGTVTGISLTGGGSGSTVSGNLIGGGIGAGASATMNVTSGFSGIVLAVGTGPASTVQGNTIQAITNTSTTSSTYGINVSRGLVTVTGNVVGNGASSKGLVVNYDGYGISIGTSAASTISNNQVVNLQTGPTPATGLYLTGINFTAGTSGTHTVTTNTVSDLLSRSVPDETDGFDTQTVGVLCLSTGLVTVQRNQLSNIGSLATTTGSTHNHYVSGLHLANAGAGSQATRNRIYALFASSPGVGDVADVVVALHNGSTSTTVANNVISVPASASAAPQVFGMLENGSANTYAYNSVYLGGQGGSDTYAFYRASTTAGLLVRNNILYNDRTGRGRNLSIGTGSATGWVAATASPSNATSDYNLFFTSDSTQVGNWAGTTVNFTNWKRAQSTGGGSDRSSMREQNTAISAASLFGNAAGGELALNVGGPAAWYANGTGVQLPGLNTDYAGNPRPTTVAAGAPDIGAVEITPTGTPPDLVASTSPSRGGTQTFWLGGRALARVAWGHSGSVPNGLTVRYYSGANPPTPFANGATYANAYFALSNDNSGSNYTYGLTLYYDPALLGSIPTEADQLMAQRTLSNSGYDLFASAVNPAGRTIAGPQNSARPGLFAIGSWRSSAARTSSPLATLTRVEATDQGSGATLNWNTASETNNAGFEVQVSTDGSSFRSLGFVAPAAASSRTAHDYTFLDPEASEPGLRYYRLRQLDLDGRERFSAVRTLQVEAAAADVLSATPNPFSTSLTLHLNLPAAGAATLRLTDAQGRVVRTQSLGQLPAGPSQTTLDNLGSLPAGLYVLRVALPHATYTTKVTKE